MRRPTADPPAVPSDKTSDLSPRACPRGRRACLGGPRETSRLRATFLETGRVTAVLRSLLVTHPHFGPLDLKDYLISVFDLSWDDVACVGGWWHDGTGELDDETIERRIAPEIYARRRRWELPADK